MRDRPDFALSGQDRADGNALVPECQDFPDSANERYTKQEDLLSTGPGALRKAYLQEAGTVSGWDTE